MGSSIGARNLIVQKRIKVRAVTTRHVYFLVRPFQSDEEIEVTVHRRMGGFSCICEHGSIWRFSRYNPSMCYHAEAAYLLLRRLHTRNELVPEYLCEAEGGPLDAGLRLALLSFLSSTEYETWGIA